MVIDKFSRILFASYGLKVSSVCTSPVFSVRMKKSGEFQQPEMELPNVYITLNMNLGEKNAKIPFQERSAFILQNEYYPLVEAWQEVYSWFRRSDMKDLYVIGDDKKLQFNTAYNQYMKTVSDSKRYPNTQKITIMPTLVNRMDSNHEGVMIHFNSLDVQTTLTISEFGNLLHTLEDFSFSNESFQMAMAYMWAERHNAVKDTDGFSRILGNGQNSQMLNKVDAIINGKEMDSRLSGKKFELK